MSLEIVILAAGQGKRMHSSLPKVLHKIAGTPMLTRVVETARQLNPDNIHVVVGHESSIIKEHLQDLPVNWIEQQEQLGTGHALMQVLPCLCESSQVLVLSGDVPLINPETLKKLITISEKPYNHNKNLGLLLAILDNPKGLGRIIRDSSGKIIAIIEEKDASTAQKTIQEIYSGICCATTADLSRWLPKLQNHNAQKEYYLTDIIGLATQEGMEISSICTSKPMEILGVNNRLQLHELERIWQKRQAEKLLLDGVSIADASRFDLRGQLLCGNDVFIDVNSVFSGKVTIGDNCDIGPNCQLTNVNLGNNNKILANSVLEDCTIEDNCQIGPFARLRKGTTLASDCKIGNFVETKNACFNRDTKANHLSYLGDVTLGKKVNIGAGTITCNYDGVNKHKTIIEDGVFIGSDSQLVAPLTIGKNATIGAGSTIRKNAPPEALTLTSSTQKTIYGWKPPEKSVNDK